ncbi:molybdate ABC transporter substrate-binding protein [Limimaricola litoreus]|uniref:Molybdate ABC transporter substrate-binding protein n=1 Tax=Limimaricola litoreus TaxID=2955316 RepID=A0A9X2FQW3_9RHOB|nr:molybdate ABC transporter substrate-binding protein [Limimaricola litoreus]MCP1168430.1 molybdate ABC transporter substrate-binding protein [Limimaricola litoreus]
MLVKPLLAALMLALAPSGAARAEILTFAAASLGGPLDRAVEAWEAQGGAAVTVSYAGSSALARQIMAGAPADLFISANEDWMEEVARAGLIETESRRDILGNALVLIAADAEAPEAEIGPGLDLATRLGSGRLAMALVDAVPAGQYGRAALEGLGLWDGIAPRVAQAENVRAALALVASGAAPYGIVYATDAAEEPRVKVVGRFAAESHPPIRYPAALVAGADPEAAGFLDFLSGPEAGAIFEGAGFILPEADLPAPDLPQTGPSE